MNPILNGECFMSAGLLIIPSPILIALKEFGSLTRVHHTKITYLVRIPTVKLKIPGKLFLKLNPELLLHSSYSF